MVTAVVPLFTHADTLAPFAGATPVPAGSFPSNHSAHPGIDLGFTNAGILALSPHLFAR